MEFRDTTDDFDGCAPLIIAARISKGDFAPFFSKTPITSSPRYHGPNAINLSAITIRLLEEENRARALLTTARTNPPPPRSEKATRSRVVESCQDATGSVSSFSRTTPTYA